MKNDMNDWDNWWTYPEFEAQQRRKRKPKFNWRREIVFASTTLTVVVAVMTIIWVMN